MNHVPVDDSSMKLAIPPFDDSATIEGWLSNSFDCVCGRRHEVTLRAVHVKNGALDEVPAYCERENIRHVLLVADANTYAAAGEQLRELLDERGIVATVSLPEGDANGDVAADEAAIVRVLIDLPREAQAIVAVGSGTIHDIARFAAFKTERRFLSVPTAPSVDGFASVGAPLIVGGFKQTLPACAPEAIFADLRVLASAPQPMIAAGFGDMLGKFTSLADWQLGRLLMDEAHCPVAAGLTRTALQRCLDRLDDIAGRGEDGIRALTEALILSGIAMLLVGHSRPASGCEHHLSHYWEMKLLQEGRKAMLHGAKVGVASVMMAELYGKLRLMNPDDLKECDPASDVEAATAQAVNIIPAGSVDNCKTMAHGAEQPVAGEEELDRIGIRRTFGRLAAQVELENFPPGVTTLSAAELVAKLRRVWPDIMETAASVPSPEQMADWLAVLGGPTVPAHLGLEPSLVEESLLYAHFVRHRFTVLRLYRKLDMYCG